LNNMNYQFPMIRHISDVLPHIEGREEFIVAEREGYTIINYVVPMADTFNMYPGGYDGPLSTYDLGGVMRRECRGLIFDDDGYLMSRPFHKFFNINERDETQAHAVDMTQPHVIMEKMDGSMIRPILVDGYLRLATKMGVTNVAMQAEEWLAAQDPALKDWMRKCVEDSVTPLFEWVSPFNQIVLAYEEADLVYLGTRCNTSGWYMMDASCLTLSLATVLWKATSLITLLGSVVQKDVKVTLFVLLMDTCAKLKTIGMCVSIRLWIVLYLIVTSWI
jgi:RNA ligase